MSLWLFHPFIGVSMEANKLAEMLKTIEANHYLKAKLIIEEATAMLTKQASQIKMLEVEVEAMRKQVQENQLSNDCGK
jgi:hypothetical protein